MIPVVSLVDVSEPDRAAENKCQWCSHLVVCCLQLAELLDVPFCLIVMLPAASKGR